MKFTHPWLAGSVLSVLLSVAILGPNLQAQANNPAAAGAATQGSSATASPSSQSLGENYVIGRDDLLSINVWKETEISRVVEVRPDGKISLPLVGELQASGLQPIELQKQIAERLKSYLSNPEVTVIVQEVRSQKFNVMGQVARPGTYVLDKPMTVLDGLALAGGFRDFAKEKKIYVLRKQPNGTDVRLPFNYKKVVKGQNLAQNVALESGDTIVVP